jgi:hypothetical protein
VTKVQTNLAVCHLAITLPRSLIAGLAEVIRVQLGVLLLLEVQQKGTNGSSLTMLRRGTQARAEASALCSRLEHQCGRVVTTSVSMLRSMQQQVLQQDPAEWQQRQRQLQQLLLMGRLTHRGQHSQQQ